MNNDVKKYLFDIQESIKSIDDEIVWGTIDRHLPLLKSEVSRFLQ